MSRIRPRDNPFRVQRLDTLDYEPQGETWADLLRRFDDARWCGAIVGPHGSGKTTLMRAMRREAANRGRDVRHVFLRADLKPDADQWRAAFTRVSADTCVFIDGYDHLPIWRRIKVCMLTRRAAVIVTTHQRALFLKTIVQTRTSAPLLSNLIGHLTDESDMPGHEQIAALHETHSGNIREALRDMYLHCAKR